MSFKVNTNVQSLAAQRYLGLNTAAQRKTLEQLSSGSRINHAADDAAGLAISEKMRADIRSLHQDVRNAQDGISVIQTAEGGISEVSNILVRMRELSIQAASDTVDHTERGFADKEVQQLAHEIHRISEATEWNGKFKLLNGQGGDLDIQVGLHGGKIDRYTLHQNETNITLDHLGLNGINIRTKQDAQENLARLDHAIELVSGTRANLGAMQNRLQSSINSLQVYHENLSSARSRIADTDVAAASAELTKRNILSQAGVAVLAQANQNPQLALRLIG